jgi:endonuclease/exonuclease/phosphatase family metal-dependent hydrolase
MTEIDFAYFNYEHGGLVDGGDHFSGSGRGYDFGGLVRVAGDGGRWPHVLVMGEADRHGYAGGEGMWEAAAAMRAAGGRPYVPLLGSLPREWGPHAPVIFADTQSVVIRRWHDHRQPDFAARNRNLLAASLPGRPGDEIFQVVAVHGDLYSGDMRLADAQALRRLADPAIPSLIAGDWNSVPSGPGWEDRELNDPRFWPPELHWARAHRVLWQHGPAQAGPCVPDTRALDYLIGWWDQATGRRAGGIGFCDVAELAGDYAPTQVPARDGRQRRAIDRMIVNQPWAGAIVSGSYHVHQPADPGHPDSDHLRVSVAIRI